MDGGSMGLADALDAQHLLKPYTVDHGHLHSIVNSQVHLTHPVQGTFLSSGRLNLPSCSFLSLACADIPNLNIKFEVVDSRMGIHLLTS